MFSCAHLISFLALIALSFVSFVDASRFRNKRIDTVDGTAALTNAQRFARGLGPLPPSRRYTGTRVARSMPSSVPGTVYTGVLRVYDTSTDNALGWISVSFSRIVELVDSLSKASSFSFTQTSPTDGFTNLMVSSLNLNLVGYVPISYAQLGTTSTNVVMLLANNGDYRTRTERNGGYNLSAMFSVSSSTGRVTAHWFNDDGAAVTVYPLLVGSVGGGFMYSGGPDYYHANSGHDFPSVYFVFE